MKLYLNNLLPRIKQFSEDLDKKEIFIDFPWVIIDENSNQQKYIFKRNGELVMSLNGSVVLGKWEYLSTAKSLLIDRGVDQILLNQNFIDPGVMILNKDGLKEDNLILANERVIPDLDVLGYLKRLFYKKNNIRTILLTTGESLELKDYEGWFNEISVSIEGEPVSDGILELKKVKAKFKIKESKIVKVLVDQTYDTDKGTITIEQEKDRNPLKGDCVYQNDISAPDGKYRIGFMRHITVKEGIIQ